MPKASDRDCVYQLLGVSNMDEALQLTSAKIAPPSLAQKQRNWLLAAQVSAEIAVHSRRVQDALSWGHLAQMAYMLAIRDQGGNADELSANLAMLYMRANLVTRFGERASDELLNVQAFEEDVGRFIGHTLGEVAALLGSNLDRRTSHESLASLRRVKNALGPIKIMIASGSLSLNSHLRNWLSFDDRLP